MPTLKPSYAPTVSSITNVPTEHPTSNPTVDPTLKPAAEPTANPSNKPSPVPTDNPTVDSTIDVLVVDCVMSEWIDEPCDAICGTGIRIQNRHVLVQDLNGGEECPSLTSQETSCILMPCSEDGEVISLQIELETAESLEAQYQTTKVSILTSLPSEIEYFNVDMQIELTNKLRRSLSAMNSYIIHFQVVVSSPMEKDLVTAAISDINFSTLLESSFSSNDIVIGASHSILMDEDETHENAAPKKSNRDLWVMVSILSLLVLCAPVYFYFNIRKTEEEFGDIESKGTSRTLASLWVSA